jgi:hypothetical protein
MGIAFFMGLFKDTLKIKACVFICLFMMYLIMLSLAHVICVK